MKADLKEEIEVPEKVEIKEEKGLMVVKGPEGEMKREMIDPRIKVKGEEGKIVLETKKGTKREKARMGAMKAHIRNMLKGVQEKFVYKLKVCSGHFPINVSVAEGELVVKNFLGEKVPRKLKILEGVEVKVEGSEILVRAVDKEKAGQMAASIEELCKIKGRDKRVFQDGCFIIMKGGKPV